MGKRKRRRGDRRDGYLIRDIDPMHFFQPYLYPDRTDNEAFISERIADGYYYSSTVRLLKKLLKNPEILEMPAHTPVEY